jgi:hypothetical protein
MDDFILFGESKAQVTDWRAQIQEYLSNLRLKLHPRKQEIHPAHNGVAFLGFHIFATHRRLCRSNIVAFRKRTRRQILMIKHRLLGFAEFHQSLVCWIGHAAHGDTWRLRKHLFRKLIVSKSCASSRLHSCLKTSS